MSKEFLFLYPIEKYARHSIAYDMFQNYPEKGKSLTKLDEIIVARYRNKGFGVSWLLFQTPDGLPDISDLMTCVSYEREDRFVLSGTTFQEATRPINPLYANPQHVINQLQGVKKLVLGGFHQNDCVDKIARHAHEQGIDTFVDEDTTEFFFGREFFHGIPLVRRKWTWKALGKRDKILADPYQIIRRHLDGRPWFTQVAE